MVRSVNDDFDVLGFVLSVLFVVLFVLFCSPVFADEPVTDEVVTDAPVEVAPVPDEVAPEPDSVSPEPAPVPEVVPQDEPTVMYDSDGVEVYSSVAPSVGLMAASSSEPYSSVTSGTYTSIAADIVPKVTWADDYVFYRAGQYVYRLAYGDLSLEGTTFSGDNLTFVDFTYSSSTTGYLMSVDTGSLNLRCNSAIVYSNLGDYPVLSQQAMTNNFLCYFSVVALAMFVIHCLYSFLLRLGVRHVQE